jgi:hypothetical protein
MVVLRLADERQIQKNAAHKKAAFGIAINEGP